MGKLKITRRNCVDGKHNKVFSHLSDRRHSKHSFDTDFIEDKPDTGIAFHYIFYLSTHSLRDTHTKVWGLFVEDANTGKEEVEKEEEKLEGEGEDEEDGEGGDWGG